jgi:O-antigen/teichoic acid export membrane protein
MSTSGSIKQKAMNALKWVALAKFSGQILSWLSTFLVIRLLTPEDYGLFALASVPFGLLLKVSYSSWGDGLIQAKSVSDEQIRRLLGLLILINGAACLLLTTLAPSLAAFFDEPRAEDLTQILALGFLAVPWIIVPEALLGRAIRFKAKSLIDLASTLASIVVSISLAWNGWGFWALIYAYLTGLAARAIGLVVIHPPPGLPSFNFRGIGAILSFGGIVALTSVVWGLYIAVDVIIGGRLLETAIVGVYATALQLATMPMNKIMPLINQVALPVFSRIQDDQKLVVWYFRRSVRLASIVAFPIIIGVAAVAIEFVPLVLGERWIDITVPLIILSFSVPFRIVMNLFAPVVKALGRPDISLGNALFTLAILVICFSFFAQWGAEGLAIGWLIGAPIAFAFTMIRSCKVISLSPGAVMQDLLAPFTLSLLMFGLVRATASLPVPASNAILELLILVLVGIISYVSLAYVLFRKNCEEIFEIWKNRKNP